MPSLYDISFLAPLPGVVCSLARPVSKRPYHSGQGKIPSILIRVPPMGDYPSLTPTSILNEAITPRNTSSEEEGHRPPRGNNPLMDGKRDIPPILSTQSSQWRIGSISFTRASMKDLLRWLPYIRTTHAHRTWASPRPPCSAPPRPNATYMVDDKARWKCKNASKVTSNTSV